MSSGPVFNKSPSLAYLGFQDDYTPSPEQEPIPFLSKHLHQLPPHLLQHFSAVTTAKARTILPVIRNRRLKYANSDPPELQFDVAKSRWPTLWQGRERGGIREGEEEKAWAERNFMEGSTKHVGKLGHLLGGYEEEREAERLRTLRREQAAGEEFVPEEDESSDEEELAATAAENESLEDAKLSFERSIRERLIYGLLEASVSASYPLFDFWTATAHALLSDLTTTKSIGTSRLTWKIERRRIVGSPRTMTCRLYLSLDHQSTECDGISRWSQRTKLFLLSLKHAKLPTLMSVIPSPANAGLHHKPVDSDVPSSQSHDPHALRKKKKKRRREDEQEAEHGEEVKQKKKKQEKRHHAERQPAEDEIVADFTPIQPEVVPVKEKKSKKKEKGKQRAPAEPEIDPALTSSNAQPSATALISAIVAAATGTPEPTAPNEHAQPPPLEPQFDPNLVPHPPPHHFMPYPFMPYGYGPQPYMPPNAMQPSTLFPTPANLALGELNFASNDDVLRALQALDVSKITNALRNLGDVTPAANESSSANPPSTPLGQVPVASGAILGLPSEGQGAPGRQRRTIDMRLPGTEHQTSPDHAYLLANKWLNASKLAELVKTEGLVYKKGKFSAIEEQQLKTALENYRITRGLTEQQMMELVYPSSDKSRDNAFWSELTSAVPQRPIIAVYHHVRRMLHPMQKLGKWSPEEDAALAQAVVDLGQQWEKVSQRVGRRAIRVTGPWSKEEEEQLTRIVTDMTIKQGKDIDNDVFWGRVSELMGGKRGRQQCRIKWTDALSKTIKNEGQKPRWSQQDAYILVHKVDSLNVRDDTEIDWKTIPDPQWNLWSAHTLQRRWLTMKRSIKGYEDMTHQEIMDILRLKKAQMPAPPPVVTRKRKERKVTSAASVVEDGPADAGSSTGQGTLAGSAISAAVVQDSSDDDTSSSSDSE
ncbi:putative myb-like DNA-binding domain containing potein [Lyophyllum shimeji]|uniref:Myb-like DNA-binding domain containing potein n=1 Tax=Lyophyllum shimeji TaxID=47721 RepID=A0A9P3UI56_LYOSH|nr:putative myb-like DNA-binding domain containing potein [Lyophyllum shimeji]